MGQWELPLYGVLRSYLCTSVRLAPANSRTSGAPTATSEATLPSPSTNTAEGVPQAPKFRPTETAGLELPERQGPSACWPPPSRPRQTRAWEHLRVGSVSHSFDLGEHLLAEAAPGVPEEAPGFQSPWKSSRSTVLPSRSGNFTSGAGSPIALALGQSERRRGSCRNWGRAHLGPDEAASEARTRSPMAYARRFSDVALLLRPPGLLWCRRRRRAPHWVCPLPRRLRRPPSPPVASRW